MNPRTNVVPIFTADQVEDAWIELAIDGMAMLFNPLIILDPDFQAEMLGHYERWAHLLRVRGHGR